MTEHPEPDITALVRTAQRGDPLATHQLIELLAPFVGRLCGPIALQDGPDAAQEALLMIFRNLRHLREPAALFGWARTIAVREAVRLTANRNPTTAEMADVPAPGDPSVAADVRDVLRRLSPQHRAVLMLRDLEGLDEHVVSTLLAVPTGTVRSRLFRARTLFRKAWQQ